MSRIIKDFNTKRAVIYLFILLTILNCGSVYYSSIINGLWKILLIVLFAVSVSKISSNILDKIINFSVLYLIYVIIFLICNYVISPNFSIISLLSTLAIEPIMLIIFFLSQTRHNYMKNCLYIYENIVIALGLISLLFWLLSSLGLKPNMSFTAHWGGVSRIPGYFGLDYLSQPKITFLGIPNVLRNCGVFTEPPMYSYVLCIALLIELFLRNSDKVLNYKVIILFIVILSTTSTTALLISIPAILLKAIICSNNNMVKWVILLLIPIFIFILRIIFESKKGNIQIASFGQSSYLQRHDDMVACIHAWLSHPILGNGINNPDVGDKFNIAPISMATPEVSKITIGGTTGLMNVMAHGGILYALIYILPSLLYSLKSMTSFIFALLSFILFIFTGVNQYYLLMVIMAYFWSNILLNDSNKFYN